jgi:hypothetical protein
MASSASVSTCFRTNERWVSGISTTVIQTFHDPCRLSVGAATTGRTRSSGLCRCVRDTKGAFGRAPVVRQ